MLFLRVVLAIVCYPAATKYLFEFIIIYVSTEPSTVETWTY